MNTTTETNTNVLSTKAKAVSKKMKEQDPVEAAVNAFAEAKRAEALAAASRIEKEQAVIALVGLPEEGSKTTKLENGWSVTVTQKINYSADMATLLQICETLPVDMRPLKTETKLDETGAKYLRNNEPETWAQLSSAITIKPAKPSVTVKV